MRLQKKVSKKEFAQEILVGSIALACLFAIFLFVAIQKSTGKNLSPLAYLWPQEKEDATGIPPAGMPQVHSLTEKKLANFDHTPPIASQGQTSPPSKLPVDNNVGKLVQSARAGDSFLPSPSKIPTTQVPNSPGGNRKPPIQSAGTASFVPSQKIQLAQHDADQVKQDRRVQPSTFIPSELPSDPPHNTGVPRSDFQPDPPQKRQATPPIFQVDAKPSTFIPDSAPSPETYSGNASREERLNSSSKNASRNRPPQGSPEFENRPDRQPLVDGGALKNLHKTDGQARESAGPAIVHSQLVPTATAKPQNSNTKSKAVENSLRIQPSPTDSFWSLSQEYYGDGKYFDQLAMFNKATDDSDNLPPVVLIPSLKELLELKLTLSQKSPRKPVESGTGLYITQKGETLFEIAKKQLGTAARFAELLRLNRDHLPADCEAQTELASGTRILLPEKK